MDDLKGISRLHMVGVGGAGMSALAKLTHQMGLRVSGSDLQPGTAIAALTDLGIETWSGHRPARMGEMDVVVASSAVPEADLELTAAAAAGVRVWRRPQLLSAITGLIPTIGVTGTHGKTTSTAMMVMALRRVGLDPSFVVGGDLIELATNAHLGRTDLLVLEVDEAFRTFEQVTLRGLVVTNVEAEHLDHFGTVDELEAAFVRVVDAVDGPVLIGHDDPGANRVADRTGRPTFGFDPTAAWHVTDLSESPAMVRFALTGPGHRLAVAVARVGIHNARNAAGVLALLAELGHDPAAAAGALADFRGVRRRFESRGRVAGVLLVDDYAHHPTEISAVIQAAATGGHRRIWAVFQPHLYSRTLRFHAQFGAALAAADRVVVTDVYAAREEPIPGVTGHLVAESARSMGAEVDYVPHRSDLAPFLSERVEPGDMVLTMGAGDVTLVPTELARLLAVRA